MIPVESLKQDILSLVNYMLQKEYVTLPIPRIRLSTRPQTNSPIYAKTGHYSHGDKEITLEIADRHPKDILRTLAHELIHVQQDHEGRLQEIEGNNPISQDGELREIEGEAFLMGNLALREWTEQYTKGHQ